MKLKSVVQKLSNKAKIAILLLSLIGGQLAGGALPFMPSSTVLADSLNTIIAKSLTSHGCDSTEWHFVITSVDTEADAPASITVTWANGQTETVALTKFTGGVAHYSTTDNLSSTVTSATTQIYTGWSGQFNLSHGPCAITPVTPQVTTQVSGASIMLGQTPAQSVTDSATLVGTASNGDITGTVAFYVCGPSLAAQGCTTGGTAVGAAVTVTNNAATSASFVPTVAGYYCFRAEYTPDNSANYLAVSHTNSDSECFVANPAPLYGSITIEKNAIPGSSQTFHFTTNGLSTDAAGFDLVDDSTAGLPQQVFSNLGAGTYSVSEAATNGWDFADLSCDKDGAAVTTTGSTASITLSGAQNVVCTYTNRERGTITVHKVTIPANDTTSFPITLSSSTGGSSTEAVQQTLSTASDVVYHVSQGNYSVIEDLGKLANWQTTDNGCSSITVNSSNLNPTCTITNTYSPPPQPISISGAKWNVNADGSKADQTGLSGWMINLFNNGTQIGSTTTGNNGFYSFTNLDPNGLYTVEEVNQAGWTPICSLVLKNVCGTNPYDFGNFQNATISGYKWNDQNQDGLRQPTEPKLAGWTIFIDSNANGQLDPGETSTTTDTSGNYSFGNLAPGDYSICEVQQSGWTQTYPGTASGCQTITVALSGRTYQQNFGNFQQPSQPEIPTGSITITKVASPSSNQTFNFLTNANSAGTFTLAGDNSADSTIKFEDLGLSDVNPNAPGTYTFSEATLANWKLESIKCDSSWGWSVNGNQLSINLSTDLANISCTFTNNKQGEILGLHTTKGGQVLGAATTSRQLVDTGSNPIIGWVISGAAIAIVLGIAWDSRRQNRI